MKKILFIILLATSNLFSQNITSYEFTNLIRKDANYFAKYLVFKDWIEIKNEKKNALELSYKNFKEEINLDSNIKIEYDENKEIISCLMEVKNKKLYENYLEQLKSNKKLKLTEEKNTEYKFISIDLKYEFILIKEINNDIELYYVIANRLEKI